MSVVAKTNASAFTTKFMSPVVEPVPSMMLSDTSFTGETSDSSLSGCELTTTVPAISIQPIVTVCKASGNKRPQMKYDPEVPLSKEETSAWRREQRRKRNRESAAACRKRQRDRISELEVEVSGWKAKFEEAIKKLKAIEGPESARMQVQAIQTQFPERCGTPSSSDTEDMKNMVSPCVSFNVQSYNMVSPCDSSPKFVPPVTTSVGTLDFPVLQGTFKSEHPALINANSFNARVEKGQHLSEMITRPAASRNLLFRRWRSGLCLGYLPMQ